jgi:hypothetical protein
MSTIQSIKLQGVLQPQALCLRSQRQGLPQKEKTQTQRKESSRIAFSINIYLGVPALSTPFFMVKTLQPNPEIEHIDRFCSHF